VPLFTGKSLWHAVQFVSPGAFVCEGVGPDADADTFDRFTPSVEMTTAKAMTEKRTRHSFSNDLFERLLSIFFTPARKY
jgi:hypothetical protein